MFETKKEKTKYDDYGLPYITPLPPPPPREVAKIRKMLDQVEVWINLGEKDIAEKHWNLISDECRKYGTNKVYE